jgi:ABC-type transport system involved in cytochrome bd biosynthesis fused ATPase/permease subunit
LRRRRSRNGLAIHSFVEFLVLPIVAAILANTLTPSGTNGRPIAAIAFALVASIVAFGKVRHLPNHATAEEPESGTTAELHSALARLSAEVGDQWSVELTNRRLDQPKPVRLRFTPSASNTVTAVSSANDLASRHSDYLNLGLATGRKQLVRLFLALPGRQLLILGERGSGKSTTALLLTTDLLAGRDDGTPVPSYCP